MIAELRRRCTEAFGGRGKALLIRHLPGLAGAAMTIAAGVIAAGPLAHLARENDVLRERLAQVQSSVPSSGGEALAHQIAAEWHALLPPEKDLPGVLAAIFEAARIHQVPVIQAEYAYAESPTAGLVPCEVRLELQAAYPAARRFINQVVLAQNGVALSRLQLSRDSIEQPLARWRVGFTVFLREEQ